MRTDVDSEAVSKHTRNRVEDLKHEHSHDLCGLLNASGTWDLFRCDWKMLRKQKRLLAVLAHDLQLKDGKSETVEAIDGLLSLLDVFSDVAEKLGFKVYPKGKS